MPALCPTCQQPIAIERCGVRLTPLKAGIFDEIKRAGDMGATTTEILRGPLYRDRARVTPDTIKAHVWQINSELEATAFRIVSDRRRWFLTRRPARRRAIAAAVHAREKS